MGATDRSIHSCMLMASVGHDSAASWQLHVVLQAPGFVTSALPSSSHMKTSGHRSTQLPHEIHSSLSTFGTN